MQASADDTSATVETHSDPDCSSFDNGELEVEGDNGPSSQATQDLLDHQIQSSSNKTDEEADARSLSHVESASCGTGSGATSLDGEASAAVAGQHFLNDSYHTSIGRHYSGEVEQFLPETSTHRDEEDSHHEDLPFTFQLPNSDDDMSKIYSCRICNFKTAFKNSLVNHQAVHSDARPWICEVCDYAAKRKQDLKKHLQTMHGLILESPSIRPGMNPALSTPGLSGQLSPVETKPQIINNIVVAPGLGGSFAGLNASLNPLMHAAISTVNSTSGCMHKGVSSSSTSLFSQHQQTMAGLIQPLPSSAQLSHIPRPSVPSVGKFIADKFPFNQLNIEANSSAAFPLSSHGISYSQASPRKDSFGSFSEDIFAQDYTLEKIPLTASAGSAHSRRLPSVSEMLPKEKGDQTFLSDRLVVKMEPTLSPCRERTERETVDRLEGQENVAKSQPHTYNSDAATRHMHRKSVSDFFHDRSPDQDILPAKVTRLSSQSSDSEVSPRVTSQSERSYRAEAMSSSVTCSRGLETNKAFHCTHCDILFFENALYLMHMGLHDNSNPWKCSVCGRTFFEKYSFTSHFINQH